MGESYNDFIARTQRQQAYYDATRNTKPVRTGTSRRRAKVSTSGAGRGRAQANKLPMYGWGFGHGGAPGAPVAQNQVKLNLQQELGSSPTDPFGGANLLDVLAVGDDGSGSRSRRGGGGGGGAAAAAAAELKKQKEAYQAMLAALTGQATAENKGFDTRQKTIGDLAAQGRAQLAGIVNGLNAAGAATRTNVGQSYDQGQAALQALGQRLAAEQEARAVSAGNTLSAFGAKPGDFTRQYGAQDLVGAQQAALLGMRTADDRMFAQRGDVYSGLNSDAQMAQANQQNVLLQQLAAARQQAAAAQAAAQAQLKLQAAQAGVKL